MKILIVAPAWIGDAVLSQPLLALLKAQNHPCTIDVLAPSWVGPVFRRMAEVDQVIDSPFTHGELNLKARWRLARQLSKPHQQYQRAYVLPNSLKSALIPFFAQIQERIGYTGESRFFLLNQRRTLEPQKTPLMVERFTALSGQDLANQKTTKPHHTPKNTDWPESHFPRLHSTAQTQKNTWSQLALTAPEQLLILCPGAEFGPAKRWPESHFSELAQSLLAQNKKLKIYLLGSPKDHSIAEQIESKVSVQYANRCLNLCGKTSLEQAIDLTAQASLLICNDSGLMHIAAALSTPLIAIFGSSSPQFTPPLCSNAQVIQKDLECSPCFKRECPLKHLDCLNTITPQQVLEACQSVLEGSKES